MCNPFYVHQVLNNPKYLKATVDLPPNKKFNPKQANTCIVPNCFERKNDGSCQEKCTWDTPEG